MYIIFNIIVIYNISSLLFKLLTHINYFINFVGEPRNYNVTEMQIEQVTYNDIILFNFIDSYRNLTIKRLVSFYFAQHAYHTKLFFNMDDDMYVNFRRVFSLITSNINTTDNIIAGFCMGGISVMRNRQNKWFVSKDNFPEPKYPYFCFGIAYIISKSAMKALLASNKNVPLLPIDDASVGILARRNGSITLMNVKGWWKRYGYKDNYCPETYTLHGLTAEQMYKMWQLCKN